LSGADNNALNEWEANDARRIDFLALDFSTSSAVADRPVTQEESERLQASAQGTGLLGGKMEVDDGKFEIERGNVRRWQDV